MLLLSHNFSVHNITCSDLELFSLPLLKVLPVLEAVCKRASSLSSWSVCSPREVSLFLLTRSLPSAQTVFSCFHTPWWPVPAHILSRNPLLKSFCMFMILKWFVYFFIIRLFVFIYFYVTYVCKVCVGTQ